MYYANKDEKGGTGGIVIKAGIVFAIVLALVALIIGIIAYVSDRNDFNCFFLFFLMTENVLGYF